MICLCLQLAVLEMPVPGSMCLFWRVAIVFLCVVCCVCESYAGETEGHN